MTLYLYTNILNVDTLLFLSHICLRTFDFIAYCHFVFVTIIPTHMVFALLYFIPPNHKAGRFVFFAWGWCKERSSTNLRHSPAFPAIKQALLPLFQNRT